MTQLSAVLGARYNKPGRLSSPVFLTRFLSTSLDCSRDNSAPSETSGRIVTDITGNWVGSSVCNKSGGITIIDYMVLPDQRYIP